ncbi:hypothetical protein [Clostridium sp.]|uniref:hypothetical protein n=1 Tax=Clostridium sp. TaxID=1506 RepID=UPI001DC2586B|nr:hypothetical protein [Clostridium sp.]MBS5985845.1 hypothetical protein [Clostridium sp.]
MKNYINNNFIKEFEEEKTAYDNYDINEFYDPCDSPEPCDIYNPCEIYEPYDTNINEFDHKNNLPYNNFNMDKYLKKQNSINSFKSNDFDSFKKGTNDCCKCKECSNKKLNSILTAMSSTLYNIGNNTDKLQCLYNDLDCLLHKCHLNKDQKHAIKCLQESVGILVFASKKTNKTLIDVKNTFC